MDPFIYIVPSNVSMSNNWYYSYQTYKPVLEKTYFTDLKGRVLKESQIKKLPPTEVIKYKQEVTRFTQEFLFPHYLLVSSRTIKENGVFKDVQATFQGHIINDRVVGSYDIEILNQKTKKLELETGKIALDLPYQKETVDFSADKALQLYKNQPSSISVDDKPIAFIKSRL